jgi:hypothetical protein
MTKLSYLLAAAAVLAIASPSLAQDAPKAGAGVSVNQGGVSAGGEVKRDGGRSEGRTEMRKEGGERGEGRMEARGERREGMRGEMRGEMRRGVNVEIGERDHDRRWHRAHAERLVIIKHRRHRHHHHEM